MRTRKHKTNHRHHRLDINTLEARVTRLEKDAEYLKVTKSVWIIYGEYILKLILTLLKFL